MAANIAVIDCSSGSGCDAIDLARIASVGTWWFPSWSLDVSSEDSQWHDWDVVDGVADSSRPSLLVNVPSTGGLSPELQFAF